ncbi:hypothetical protein FOC84_21245 [Achromobacter pestifer]|uniref:HEPN domain-containing protein n=1 Tax=Achromobacter pestifer TaxID=1353889 RepID=A0A7D4IA91_9BURK|nr:hypothetical protein [Achromobacter pestifer]QKH37322.1 hypothetical protein FOC84_21245 [Achromobacter pestifer]
MAHEVFHNGKKVGEFDAESRWANSPADQARIADILAPFATAKAPISQAERMASHAHAFATVALHLYNNHRTSTMPGMPSFLRPEFLSPFCVNASLAIELMLKALAEIHGTNIKKVHELDKLFNALPVAARAQLNAEIRSVDVDGRHFPGGLQAALPQINRAFVEWRYAYEHSNISPFPMDGARVILEACRRALVVAFQKRGIASATGGKSGNEK